MSLIADRYELLDALGHGGMASVHVARDRVLDRRVAMKLLRQDIGRDPVLRERFLREARLSAGLAHAHIVRVYDAGVDGETPWIAMELVEGPSLREEMTRLGPMAADRAVALANEVLAGLSAAHRAGVIHRDVKPANVLLTGPEERGGRLAEAKLGDFGIAKSLESFGADLTQTNQFMGTPKYIAPEVAIGMPASVRSDLYSAAVVLWEMLAGEPPFDHANPLTLAMMHRTDPVPALGGIRPDLPTGLVQVLELALAKEPEDRPADAVTMADLLVAGLAGQRIGAAAAIAPTLTLPTQPPLPVTPSAPPLVTPPAAISGPPAPVQREQTVSMPRPAAPPRPAPSRGPARQDRGGWGLALVVALLLGLAVVAFALTSTDGDPAVTPSIQPTVTATPTAAGTEPTPSADPRPTTTEAPAPQPTATPLPAPTPTPAPSSEPVPEPTPDPPEQPAPTPEPTAEPTPLIPPIVD